MDAEKWRCVVLYIITQGLQKQQQQQLHGNCQNRKIVSSQQLNLHKNEWNTHTWWWWSSSFVCMMLVNINWHIIGFYLRSSTEKIKNFAFWNVTKKKKRKEKRKEGDENGKKNEAQYHAITLIQINCFLSSLFRRNSISFCGWKEKKKNSAHKNQPNAIWI